ncbi:hypothetical protein H9P43_008779 [Blastocladiella emersonii ATCC 22665]|nr:hypothetical protein H9P43_008779 [Blastocladiella emersonii ATCC 22665]
MKLYTLIATLALVLGVQAAPGGKKTGDAIPNQFIIRLKPGVDQAAFTRALKAEVATENAREGVSIQSTVAHEYNLSSSFKGYAGTFSPGLAKRLKSHPKVAAVEPDTWVSISEYQQSPPSWGLSRISSRPLDVSGDHWYLSNAGEGVDVYVIDTGVMVEHKEFEGRASWGYACRGCSQQDKNGHGTHVAGTVAGVTTGAAKKASVIAVRVFNEDGTGQNSEVIAGINWVAKKANETGRRSIANLSLGGGFHQASNDAASALAASGVLVVVSGGNDNVDACGVSPASAAGVMAVGSTTKTDSRSSFSNFGRCLDIFAPGSDIYSAWNNGGYKTISGTSMASPMVAGIAAVRWGLKKDMSSTQIFDLVINDATTDKLTSIGAGSPNRLAYLGYYAGVDRRPIVIDPPSPGLE